MSTRPLLNALVAAALMPMAAQAGPVTYVVDRSIGGGSVKGTITIDNDSTATLINGEITAYSLTLNNGITSVSITESDSDVDIFGGALTADADSIDFDFTGSASSYLFFQNPVIGSGINFWCVETFGCNESSLSPSETVKTSPLSSGVETVVRSGNNVSIATIAANNVPEPATLTLAGLALLGLAAARRRRA